jgi:hypothetical protein
MFILRVALWFAYGLAIRRPAVILANGVTPAISAVLLVIKLRYG